MKDNLKIISSSMVIVFIPFLFYVILMKLNCTTYVPLQVNIQMLLCMSISTYVMITIQESLID